MSELTAAIELLESEGERERNYNKLNPNPFATVIRILETVKQIDRNRALRVLAILTELYIMSGRILPKLEKDLEGGGVRELRALLESLPDPPKETK